MKRVAVCSDLSGLGGCSLTAALPVYAAMGIRACPFPTAVLSNQTGYETYAMADLTEEWPAFLREWQRYAGTFDAVATGYLTGVKQAELVRELVKRRKPGGLLLVDPILGDDGVPYPTATPAFQEAMRGLVVQADIITPNLTEACLLTGRHYPCPGRSGALEQAEDLAAALQAMGPNMVAVTGIHQDGRLYNLVCRGEERFLASAPAFPGSFSGTGDLFAAVLLGGLLNHGDLQEALDLATGFVAKCVEISWQAGTDPRSGVEFETMLPRLWQSRRTAD